MDPLTQLNTALEGRYEIEQELGAGGMATVYLARDLKHNRHVALKVLRADLGAVLGAERFFAEIEVTANLQHPNLLPLFDSGEADGQLFYVMPYVEGESLRARLDREKQLPVDDALHIATAVAGALDYAHRHGVVHRDLKPENILLHEGQPMVADFGIALAVSNAGGGRITQTGVSLGTPQYMSPEQATGDRVIDARTDIYSLGAVTYEMLTGESPHVGTTSQAIIARLLTEPPRSIRATRPNVPEHVERAVTHALEKLPADRFGTAQEFADALAGKVVLAPTAVDRAAAATTKRAPAGRPTWREALAHPLTRILAALLFVALIGAVAGAWWLAGRETPGTPVQFVLTLEDSLEVAAHQGGTPFALSPDGRILVFVGRRSGGPERLYERPIGDLQARELAGTDGAMQPFFSPDGRWIGFVVGTKLQKVPVQGGTPVVLADVGGVMAGASWAVEDEIVYGGGGGLSVVPAVGGAPRTIATLDSMGAPRWPLALPDGKSVIYTQWPAGHAGPETSRLAVASISGGAPRTLDLRGTNPLGLIGDELIYASPSGAVMAVTMDVEHLTPTGTPAPVIDGVAVGSRGAAKASVSRSGSVAYVIGVRQAGEQVMTFGPSSAPEPLFPQTGGYAFPRYSPDGRHIALSASTSGRSDVWVFDLPSGPLRRLTVEGSQNDRPEWTPDGRDVLFRSDRSGRMATWMKPVDGSGAAKLFYGPPGAAVDEAVPSRDGRYLVLQLDTTVAGTGGHSFYRAMHGDTAVKPLTTAVPGQQIQARLSPDGRWVAYSSSETGRFEVYVKPFPSLDARYQISMDGGGQPVWAPDGRRLFYVAGEPDQGGGTLVSARLGFAPFTVTERDSLLADVLTLPVGTATFYHAQYDVAPDGRTFVFLRQAAQRESHPVVVVYDWKDELQALLSARGGN